MARSTLLVRLEIVLLWLALSLAAGFALGRHFEPYQPGHEKFHPRPTPDQVTEGLR